METAYSTGEHIAHWKGEPIELICCTLKNFLEGSALQVGLLCFLTEKGTSLEKEANWRLHYCKLMQEGAYEQGRQSWGGGVGWGGDIPPPQFLD